MVSKTGATVGRFLLGLVFIASGIGKVSVFDAKTGGPSAAIMAPKLERAMQTVQDLSGFDASQFLPRSLYPNLVLTAGTVEILGGVLFTFNLSAGAYALMLYTLLVTPIMHNFWDEVPHGPEMQDQILHFMKNLSIVGGLVMFLCTTNGVILRRKRKLE